MRRRVPEFNFWPSVADTMLVAFIILLGLWFGYQSLTKLEAATGTGGTRISDEEKKEFDRLRKLVPELERELLVLRNENERLRADVQAKDEAMRLAKERIKELEKQKIGLAEKLGGVEKALGQAKAQNDKPPIISLPETSGYKFGTGTAELTDDFTFLLEKTVFADIRKVLDRGDVNTIEIIGHTDGQSVRRREASNLDAQLGSVLAGQQTAKGLKFGSNADLGLVRAVAVRREIEAWLSKQDLSGKIQIRCYSAANSVPLCEQLADPKVFAGEEAARRRIEIRFTQLVPVSPTPTPPGQ